MTDIQGLLGNDADDLLTYTCKGITADQLTLPGGDIVDRVYAQSDRSPQVLRNLQAMFGHGRLAGTGYVSILPVDQGIEHSAAASFAPNPAYFDPKNIIELAIEGGCNAVATTFGVLGMMSRSYAHKIPFIAKINHNELMTYPNEYDQIMFGSVEQAYDLGAAGVGATIYFGSPESHRQIIEVAEAFHTAHQLGMFTVLWCYLRNNAFKVDGVDYHDSADLTAQANHLGVTIEADIIKQKLPTKNGGYNALSGLRQDLEAGLRRPRRRQPDRLRPLAGRQLLHGPHRAHQLRWRVQGRVRPGRRRAHRRRQQACRWHRADLGPQGVPAPDGRGHRAPQRHPGRLPRRLGHHRLAPLVGGPPGPPTRSVTEAIP